MRATALTPGDLQIEVVNDATRMITFAVWEMSGPTLDDELADKPAGTDMALPPDDEAPTGELAYYADVPPGGTQSWSVPVSAGNTYLIDCLTTATSDGDNYYDHLWRPAVIEVVEP